MIYKYTYFVSYFFVDGFNSGIAAISVSRIEKITTDKDVFSLADYIRGQQGCDRVSIINWKRVKYVPDDAI